MPDQKKILADMSASERRHRAWATWRLNRSLAKYTSDPWLTKYEWQLVPVLAGSSASWRDFRRGQLGHPWPQLQWAITTLTIGTHKMLMGGVILSTTHGKPVRWAHWHEFPQAMSEDELYYRDERPYRAILNKHEFRRIIATLD